MFLDAGPLLAPLLAQCSTSPEQVNFAAQIEAARGALPATAAGYAGAAANNNSSLATRNPLPALVQPQHPDLIELLTTRELEVLRLLARRLTNKEIAAELGISLGTVKQHTRVVFSKLHAENRRDVILQAHKLGFQLDERITW
jgi:LuxR family maltose regulon positive regulatory protein